MHGIREIMGKYGYMAEYNLLLRRNTAFHNLCYDAFSTECAA